MTDRQVLLLSYAFHSANCEITSGTIMELATKHILGRLLQPCGPYSVTCMRPLWHGITVQVLIDHEHAR